MGVSAHVHHDGGGGGPRELERCRYLLEDGKEKVEELERGRQLQRDGLSDGGEDED
jgi:hypothetical protein